MDVFKAIKTRQSTRSYKITPVPEEKLKKVLEAARLAPSAHNTQDWKFIIVKDSNQKEKLAEAAGKSFVAEAPVIIVAVGLDPKNILSSGVPAYAVNLAIAVEHIVLQAVEEGLGTCWIGAFNQEKVKKVLDIPATCKVVALLPIGFPADKLREKVRKNLEEIVSYENFKGRPQE